VFCGVFLFATEFGGVMVKEDGWRRDWRLARLNPHQATGYLNARKEQYLVPSPELGIGIEVVVEKSSDVTLERRQLKGFK